MKIRYFMIVVMCLAFSFSANAEKLRLTKLKKCNKKQTKCLVDSKRLTIGDRFGFFTDNDLVVAIGRVAEIKNGLRVVKISKKYGKLPRTDYVDLWRSNKDYTPYVEKAGLSIGFDLGLGSYDNAGNTDFYDIGFYAEWKDNLFGLKLGDLLGVVLRANVYSGNDVLKKNLSVQGNSQQLTYDYSVFAGGLMLGLSINPWHMSTVSPRLEVAGGFGFASQSIETDTNFSADSFDIKVQDGGNLLGSARLNIMFNFGKWHPNVGVSATLVGEAVGTGFHLGLLYDI